MKSFILSILRGLCSGGGSACWPHPARRTLFTIFIMIVASHGANGRAGATVQPRLRLCSPSGTEAQRCSPESIMIRSSHHALAQVLAPFRVPQLWKPKVEKSSFQGRTRHHADARQAPIDQAMHWPTPTSWYPVPPVPNGGCGVLGSQSCQ
jgi:hypothetical protein